MFISFFTGKVMLFYGISLIMKEKSNASALGRRHDRIWAEMQPRLGRETVASPPAFADKSGIRVSASAVGQRRFGVGRSKSQKNLRFFAK